MPMSIGLSGSIGILVVMIEGRKLQPNSGVMTIECLPCSPRPASTRIGGTIRSYDAPGV